MLEKKKPGAEGHPDPTDMPRKESGMSKRVLNSFLLWCLFVVVGVFPMTQAVAKEGLLNLSVRDGYVTADIRQKPLVQVLAALATQKSLRVELQGVHPATKISVSFVHLPFEQALDRLLADFDYAIIRTSPTRLLTRTNVHASLGELLVLQRGGTAQAAPFKATPQPLGVNAGKPALIPESTRPVPLERQWTSDDEEPSGDMDLQEAVEQALKESDAQDREDMRALLTELNDPIP